MKRPHVLILEGGRSVEYEVSLRSSSGIQKALREAGFSVGVLRIERDGSWGDVRGDWPVKDRTFILSADPARHASLQNVVVFPVLHGAYGEDGTIQGALELANTPYVGCGVLASALGLHKGKQKELFMQRGLTVAPWISFSRSEWKHNQSKICKRIESFFDENDSLFVKPIRTGSSVGVSKVKNRDNIISAIDTACLYYDECIIEQSIQPMLELEVSILGTTNPESSVIGEIVPDREFYDYDAKYSEVSQTALRIDPDDIKDVIKNRIREQALIAFQAIACSGLARVDFFLQGEKIVINEINTMPGFTDISMYPKLWEASGISFSKLCEKLVLYGQEVWEDKQKNRTSIV